MEPKQPTPSVIEKLMCPYDFLPPQPICKPGRVLSENYLRKSASIGLLGKRSYHERGLVGKRSYHERGPVQINHEKGQEFINVFEVPKRPTMHRQQHLQSIQGGKANSSTTKVKMSYERPKFTEAEHLSMDEKLWHSKQFGKQFGEPHFQSSHITVLKSSNAPYSRNSEIFRKSERTTARRNILRFCQKLENGFIADSWSDLDMEYTHQLLKSQLELKDEICPPSRIVVLKPNIGKAKNAAGPFFSRISEEDSQPCDRKQVEFSKLKSEELHFQARERKNLPKDWELSDHSLGVSGEFAKGTSRQIPHSISISLTELPRTELRVSETPTNESELIMPCCSSFVDWRNQVQSTYPPLSGSSLVKQTNKRMSGRWTMTKSLQEVGLASRGTSPSKTLAMPDQKTIPKNLNHRLDISGLNNLLNPVDRDADLGSPLCFSSGDGWKEDRAKRISRSESLFASCVTTEIPKSGTRNKAICNDCNMKLQESLSQRNSETMKQKCSHNDSSEVRVPSLSNEKDKTLPYMSLGNNFTVQETCVILDEQESKIEKKKLSEESFVNCNLPCSSIPCSDLVYDQTVQGTVVLENSCKENDLSGNSKENSLFHNSSITIVASSSLDTEAVAVAETDHLGISLGTPEDHQSEAVASMMFVKDGHCSHVSDASDGQESLNRSHEEALVPSSCPGIDPEFHLSLDEGHSSSPNSVMEPPFGEEFISGSGCFQCLRADLHGLRNQLQLLKSESEETNSEGPGMAVSSDEDSRDGSVVLSEESSKLAGLFRAEQNRDFSYLVDVLDEGGFYGNSMQLGFETWHSLDCPLNPLVFEMLEKNYGEQTSWEKSERRLLFDRINSGLKEILQPCMDVLAWAKPLRKRFNHSQSREVIEEELWILLQNQEKEASKDLSEKALETNIQSFELREDIDSIVCEIESFLFDELAAELSEH